MRQERTLIEARQREILRILIDRPDISVNEIAEWFSISAITVRRDLNTLEKMGCIVRHYGGAAVTDSAIATLRRISPPEKRLLMHAREQIAKRAASFVENNDTIFINTSNTAIKMLPYITAKNVTVITNNGNAINSDFSPEVHVFLTGGELRHPRATLVGDYAVRLLNSVLANKSFLGCNGICISSGMTTRNTNEVNINEIMSERVTGCTYILADHSKIGFTSNFASCPLSRIGHIITDDHAPAESVEGFRDLGIEVHICTL